MKLVKEILYEKFIQDSDPISDLGIGEIHQIQKTITDRDITKASSNELLVLGVNRMHIQLINYALKNGADQLWWQSGGPFGGYHGLTSNMVNELIKIIGVRGNSIVYKTAATYSFKDKKFKKLESKYSSTSRIFTDKFSPVDDHFIGRITEIKKKATALLKIIKKD